MTTINSRVCAYIDLDAVRSNVAAVQKRVGDKVKVMVILKADAYGHGAVPIAKALEDGCAYAFGVATVEEGVQLRESGTKKPILVLSYAFPELFEKAIENEIDLTVFEYSTAKQLSDVAVSLGKKAGVHIKIDTGMHRIGLYPSRESLEEIRKIADLPAIEIKGVFSHLACADFADKSFANAQIELFKAFTQEITDCGIEIPIRHIYNSAATMDYDGGCFDMVRCGIVTYGLDPSDEVRFENLPTTPVMQIKSHVAYVKKVEKDATVGYGAAFMAKRETLIATIPCGYGDCYPRLLTNKGRVLIKGHSAPVTGRVCMDQFMVDVTDIPDVKQGDEVTIVGFDGKECLTVEELAKTAGSFNYEYVCDITKRVPRVYIENGKIIG